MGEIEQEVTMSILGKRLEHVEILTEQMYKCIMGNSSDGLKSRVVKLENSLKYILIIATGLGGCIGFVIGRFVI